MRLQIANNQCCFEKNGRPYFWLGDTLWSAFTNMTDQELESYLTLRAQQGFNTLQINILPQWDRCWVPAPYLPFPLKENGMFDFSAGMNDAYFEHAAAMCERIAAYGFVPALVVLWCNYVPGTWASKMSGDNLMPKACIEPYCQKVAETFARFEPVFVISGDTDWTSPESIEYYQIALKKMKELCPEVLYSAHICGRATFLPDEVASGLDFYMYQSGHRAGCPERCHTMPQEMRTKYPRKPLINAEPCYEQMGYSGNQYGRFDPKDIRRAAWVSILSGACAGITYGAHGIWNWQKPGMPTNPNIGEGFDEAKPWTEALQFPGAWDFGFLKQLMESLQITVLLPSDRVANKVRGIHSVTDADGSVHMKPAESENAEIRMAVTPDEGTALIYAPFNTRVVVRGDFSGYQIRTVDLAGRRVGVPRVFCENGMTSIEMCPFAEDVLIVAKRNSTANQPNKLHLVGTEYA